MDGIPSIGLVPPTSVLNACAGIKHVVNTASHRTQK
jgi:hypothetical protein